MSRSCFQYDHYLHGSLWASQLRPLGLRKLKYLSKISGTLKMSYFENTDFPSLSFFLPVCFSNKTSFGGCIDDYEIESWYFSFREPMFSSQ